MELFHPTSGSEDTNLTSHGYATAKQQINQEYQDLVHSQLLKCSARYCLIEVSAEQHISLPLLCVKQCKDVFAGHEALFHISHFQVVQRQHVLLLFFLGKKRIKTTLCEKKPDVSKICWVGNDLGTFVIIRKYPNLNVCLSFIDLPAREMKPQFQFCFSLTLLKHFLIKKFTSNT